MHLFRDYLVAESMDKRKKPFDMSDWSMEIVKVCEFVCRGFDEMACYSKA